MGRTPLLTALCKRKVPLERNPSPTEEIIRTLNTIGYKGPLSVEWEDSAMDRVFGAKEACSFVKRLDFEPCQSGAFDAAFEN